LQYEDCHSIPITAATGTTYCRFNHPALEGIPSQLTLIRAFSQ